MFFTFPNLQQYDIGMNKISGPILASISNAIRLLLFNIPWNNFVGPVPTGTGNLQDVWSIAMERNYLRSNSSSDLDFFTSLTNCTKLQVLGLNLNNFGGSLSNFGVSLMIGSNVKLQFKMFSSIVLVVSTFQWSQVSLEVEKECRSLAI